MPRSRDPGRPPEPNQLRLLRVGFQTNQFVAICRYTLTRLCRLQTVRSVLWPIWFPVYASCNLFSNRSRTMKSLQWYQPSVAPLLQTFITSSLHATLGTSGWLNLSRQGLSPCKRHQASLGARPGGESLVFTIYSLIISNKSVF